MKFDIRHDDDSVCLLLIAEDTEDKEILTKLDAFEDVQSSNFTDVGALALDVRACPRKCKA